MDRYEQAIREMVVLLRHGHPDEALAVGEEVLGTRRTRRTFRKTDPTDLVVRRDDDPDTATG